ncbi:MAG: DUF1326 domain-containing protein [Chloroflexi bacterium]|nr:DUF1326 domain-containing protein [Chloroflexota bacterium]
MAWRMTGRWINSCSCKALCPCFLGPAEPDQGWCSGADVYEIQEGESDGVSLAGCKVADALDLPGDFFSGNGTARLYIDEAASPEQRRELEAIFSGKKGGVWEAFASAVAKWLPAQVTKIAVQGGDNPSATVGSVGQVTLQPIKMEDGRPTKVVNAPALGAFQVESMDLASGKGTRWADPEMRRWESGGHAAMTTFNWSA